MSEESTTEDKISRWQERQDELDEWWIENGPNVDMTECPLLDDYEFLEDFGTEYTLYRVLYWAIHKLTVAPLRLLGMKDAIYRVLYEWSETGERAELVVKERARGSPHYVVKEVVEKGA